MFNNPEITQLPLSVGMFRKQAEQFLASAGLRLDPVDYYAVARQDDGRIVAGGGLEGGLIKCVAVADDMRGTGLMQSVISHLISVAQTQGHKNIKVFTKPDNRAIFEALGFRTLAQAEKAIFMENGVRGLNDYLDYLRALAKPGDNGLIVMNANPFTKGHRALVEYAAGKVDTLYVIAVKEDRSAFTSSERFNMIAEGCADIPNVIVAEGSDYAISAATFPTYFLKQISDATDTQIDLDLDLCRNRLMPALNARVRFVGSEPDDPLTARYVEKMRSLMPCDVLERIAIDGRRVSASTVRQLINDGNFEAAQQLVPSSTIPYLIAHLAARALTIELDTTPKPGLVDRNDTGAHSDMDHELMRKSIHTLTPHFARLARLGMNPVADLAKNVIEIGLEAEADMMRVTGNVNTHKGALFSLGLVAVAAGKSLGNLTPDALQATVRTIASGIPGAHDTHGTKAVAAGAKGALANAEEGYADLFADWLPYFRSLDGDPYRCHKTLLRIMATIDDTNIIFRKGTDTARQVKLDAAAMLSRFDPAQLSQMNLRYNKENISPGGAADMLSLTILVDSLLS